MNDSLQGSLCEAHAICPIPPSVCRSVVVPSGLIPKPGCCGSQLLFGARKLAPTGAAPAPAPLHGCTEPAVQRFERPWSFGRELASAAPPAPPSRNPDATATPRTAAPTLC